MKSNLSSPSPTPYQTNAPLATANPRREWCKAAIGLAAISVVPVGAALIIEQRQGWLLLSSDR